MNGKLARRNIRILAVATVASLVYGFKVNAADTTGREQSQMLNDTQILRAALQLVETEHWADAFSLVGVNSSESYMLTYGMGLLIFEFRRKMTNSSGDRYVPPAGSAVQWLECAELLADSRGQKGSRIAAAALQEMYMSDAKSRSAKNRYGLVPSKTLGSCWSRVSDEASGAQECIELRYRLQGLLGEPNRHCPPQVDEKLLQ